MGVILLTGVPGTGKSTIGSILASRLGCEVIEVGKLARDRGLTLGWDEERESEVLDVDGVRRELHQELVKRRSKVCVVISLYPDLVPPEFVDKVVILRCDPAILAERLKKRGYNKKKIVENIEAEIVDFCWAEACRVFPAHVIFEVDVSKSSPREVADLVLEIVRGKKKPSREAIVWPQGPLVLQSIKKDP